MAAGVKVHATVLETRRVKDAAVGKDPIGLNLLASVDGGGEHLLQGFARIHKTVQGRCLHKRPLFPDIYGILFLRKVGIHSEVEAAIGIPCLYSGGCFQCINKAQDGIKRRGVQILVKANGSAFDAECAVANSDAFRHGYHMKILWLLRAAGRYGNC